MKLYLIYAHTEDYYEPEELYAVATSKEEAKRLKKEAEDDTLTRLDGSTWKWYEKAEIEEVIANKEIDQVSTH